MDTNSIQDSCEEKGVLKIVRQSHGIQATIWKILCELRVVCALALFLHPVLVYGIANILIPIKSD